MELLTTEEVAAQVWPNAPLDKALRRLRYWIYNAPQGRLPHYTKETAHGQGGRLLFHPDDVARFVKERSNRAEKV